jgi:hypothetical protein
VIFLTNNEKQVIFLTVFSAEKDLQQAKELYELNTEDGSAYRWYRGMVDVKVFTKKLIKNLGLENEYVDWVRNGKVLPFKSKYS